MKFDLRDLGYNKDFLAGLFLILLGGLGMYMAFDYPMGSALRMGPGYFPRVLGGICIAFGIFVLVKGLLKREKIMGGNWSVRALILLPLSAVVYGVVMERAGFIAALLALVFVSAAAGRSFRFLEVLLLAIGLTAMSVGLFIYALGLPYPLFAGY